MKVAYDISLLGRGLNSPKARTGVHRVVENTFRGLCLDPRVEVVPVCSVFNEIYDCEAYLAGVDWSENPLVSLFSAAVIPNARARGALRSELRGLKAASLKGFSFIDYIKRKVLRLRLSRIPKASASDSDIGVLGELEVCVYHSSCEPVPDAVLNMSGIVPFLTVHDLILVKHPEFFIGNEQRGLCAFLQSFKGREQLFCVSESTRSDLLAINPNLDASLVHVTHLAAGDHFRRVEDVEGWQQVQLRYGLPDAPYFLSLSTLEPRKNLRTVIRSFVELAKRGECLDASLVLVGGLGWDYQAILDEVGVVPELRDRIVLTGFVDDGDLATIYSHALVFLYLSFYEGFGLPPLEAMRCGVPVITSNNSSLPEVVGDAGILLGATDVAGVCSAMLEFYRKPDLRLHYSNLAIERAGTFSWERHVEQTINVYRGVSSGS